ncbi:MAG TPA: Mpo1-like protein [Chthoniobacterales bacterium]|nr:Mpo1-like protein [Chthoniobacterales bacterium]
MKVRGIVFGDTPVGEWVERYELSHRHPLNRALHTLGIPLIVLSVPLFLFSAFIRGFWRVPLSLFTLGWICQFAGHTVEGKPPEFMKDWRFLLVGLRWWLNKVFGYQGKREVS